MFPHLKTLTASILHIYIYHKNVRTGKKITFVTYKHRHQSGTFSYTELKLEHQKAANKKIHPTKTNI